MIRTALLLVRDLLRFVALTCTSHASLAAENLFLRRQLAFYLEGDLVFQKGLRKQLLHTGVFGLELLQSLRVGDAHPDELAPPQAMAGFREAGAAAHVLAGR